MSYALPALQTSLPAFLDELRAATTFESASAVLLEAALLEAEAGLRPPDQAQILRAALSLQPGAGYRGVVFRERVPAERDQTPVALPSMTAWRWVRHHGEPFFLNVVAGTVGAARGGADAHDQDVRPVTAETAQILGAGAATHIYGVPVRRDLAAPIAVLTFEFQCLSSAGEALRVWRRIAAQVTLLADVAAPFLLGLPFSPFSPSDAGAWLPVVGRAMSPVIRLLEQLARGPNGLLLLGPSGVGKSQLAQAIHQRSPRAKGPFCHVVLASDGGSERGGADLFGWTKGSFTGADRDHPGLIAQADRGTLFLDEVGELSAKAQVSLLHFLDSKRWRPLGWRGEEKRADVRVLAATNRDLDAMVAEGSFRQDLYYRLAGAIINVPGLEERRDEIAGWTEFLLSRRVAESGRGDRCQIASEAVALLESLPWPGNLRELRNVVEMAFTLADRGVGPVRIELADVRRALPPSQRGGALPLRGRAAVVGALRGAAQAWMDSVDELGVAGAGGLPLQWRDAKGLFRAYLLVEARRRHGLAEGLRRLGEETRVRQNNHSRAEREAVELQREFERGLLGGEQAPPSR